MRCWMASNWEICFNWCWLLLLVVLATLVGGGDSLEDWPPLVSSLWISRNLVDRLSVSTVIIVVLARCEPHVLLWSAVADTVAIPWFSLFVWVDAPMEPISIPCGFLRNV